MTKQKHLPLDVKKVAVTAAAAKALREAERDKRFPTEANKAAVKAAAKAEGKPVKAIKPAKEQVAFLRRILPKGSAFYAISMAARPTKNPLLFAHTQAALGVLNMFAPDRPAVPKTTLVTLIGDRAVKHHSEKGNFESAKDHGIRLSAQGRTEFASRKVDNKVANAFVELFISGKAGADTQVRQGEVYAVKA